MTKIPETLVTFLLDRTGSMQSIKDDTIGAFNAYLEGLQRSGEAICFSLLQFDSMSIDTLAKNLPVAEVAPLDGDSFQPRASTPLIDAAVKTIKAVEEALAKRKGTPKVVVCIQTDGLENASVEHSWADLNALIKDKVGQGWQFNFMGAGIDAYQQGARMGIAAESTLSYSKDRMRTHAAFAARAAATAAYASGARTDMSFSPAEKAAAGDQFAPTDPTPQDPAGHQAPRRPIVDDVSL
jgi:hypothetical protein